MAGDWSEVERRLKEVHVTAVDRRDRIHQLNTLIDQLNEFNYSNSLNITKDRLDVIVRDMCLLLEEDNSLTVGKLCQLLLNLDARRKLELSDSSLSPLQERMIQVLASNADLSYLDVLQLLRTLISSHPNFFSKNHSALLVVLKGRLEENARLSDSQAIKLYRLHTLVDLTPFLSKEPALSLIDHFLDVFYNQESTNPLLLSKVWSACLEGVSGAVVKLKEVGDLSKLMGAIVSGLKLGLGASRPGVDSQRTAALRHAPELPPTVQPIYPSPLPPPVASSTPRSTPSEPKSGGGRWRAGRKSKAEVEWCCEESIASWPSDDQRLTSAGGATSDSDNSNSDSESGRRAREFAKTRHTAAYALIHVVRSVERKSVCGYYSLLLGSNCLQANMISDSMLKPKLAAVIAVRTVLYQSKPYLALAQHSECKSFTAYSEGLSELLVGLHSSIAMSLACGGGHHAVSVLLHCLSTLATVCPYHRLKSGLLTKAFTTLLPHLHASNKKEMVSGIQCLSTLIGLESCTGAVDELKHLLTDGPPGSALALSKSRTAPWIMALTLDYLQRDDESDNENVRVAQWQLANSLVANHYDCCCVGAKQLSTDISISPDLMLEDLIISEISTPNKSQLVYITVLRTLAILLEQLASKEKWGERCSEVWIRLLCGKSPLVPYLQHTSVLAASACDCVATISQQAFYSLPERSQIGLMTLVYGCCHHEEKSVRGSAINVLGALLNFPTMASESYLYDIVDILVRSAKDSSDYCRMRAAWAFGNLADLLRNKEPELLCDISLIKLINSCLLLSNDSGSGKLSVVRGLGLLLSMVGETEMKQPVYREALDKVVALLVKSANSATYMKVRWNACYAMSHLLSNKALQLHSSNWFERCLKSLCGLLVKCNHFKVRSNACTALRSVSRCPAMTPALYSFIWESLLDGLDNSANMPDFKEYRQQTDLLNQLCMSVCHMITLMEEGDVSMVRDLLEYREECLSRYLSEFVTSAPPELVSESLTARSTLTHLNNPFPLLANALTLPL